MVRLTDCPDMTSAVDRGHKALNQTNKQNSFTLSQSKMGVISTVAVQNIWLNFN